MREKDDLTQVKVGDRLVLTSGYRQQSPEDVYVTKVGTKLLTIERYNRPHQFRIESGSLNSKDYPYHAHVYTPEFYTRMQYRAKLDRELWDLGIRFDVGGSSSLSNEAIEKITEIVKEDRSD